jgi:hypothetical protein
MFRTAAFAGFLALALGPSAGPSPQSRPVSLEGADCTQVNAMFGGYEIGRAEQHGSVPLSVGTLEVRPDANGGVRIERGTGSAYTITACIATGARTRAEAQAAADGVRLVVDGNRVRVTGTGDRSSRVQNWSVQLIVAAPDGAVIDAETSNGPIGVTGVSGTITATASNGPSSLNDVAGTVKARAANGPISVDGGRGEYNVETANGPINVRLSGRQWEGHLEARAANGPLTVNVPAGYQSGVEISSSTHSPWNCRSELCRAGTRDWDERSRSLRLGAEPVLVKLSTVNGPVTISDR